jgi:MscS family membrane protein
MRKHPTIHRFIWLIILSTAIGSTTPLWAAQDTPAETNRPEPTVRDLIERKVKSEQATKQADAESAQIGVPEDPLGRGVPRSTVRGFFSVTKKRDYAQAAEYLDLRNLPAGITQADGPELARQLKIVLDRVLWIDLDLLSTSPDGDREDGLPMARDRIGRIKTEEGKTYDILLQRVPRGDGAYIWKFSSATAADIPDLYKEFGYGPFEAILPARLFDMSFLGIHAAAWAVVIILGILLYPVTLLIIWSLTYVVSRFHPELASDLTRFFTGPARLYIWTVLVRAVRHALIGTSITGGALERAHTLQLIALVWFLMRLVDFSLYRAGVTLDRKGLAGARVLLVPAARLVKVFALAGAILLWLDNVGYKVTTLLAGLSISGVAVALASQKSIENIFGAVTLYTARPVKVGDFCRFGDKMGTVEEIGLRATRIRTLERSIVTVANAEFADMHLDNLSARDRFWYHPLLQLRYETTPDQIRYILAKSARCCTRIPKY